MKTKIFFFLVLISMGIFTGCKKQDTPIGHTPQEEAARLYLTESFIRFSGNFLQDFYEVSQYINVPGIRNNRADFIAGIQQAGSDDQALEQHFASYALSFDEWIARKNKVDNDWLQLFHQLPELRRYNEQDVLAIVKEGIRLGIASEDARWQALKSKQFQIIGTGKVVALGAGTNSPKVMRVDASEIWNCLKDAIGVGSASVLGIAGLNKLAGQGLQAIVTAGSKLLAKYAGWIGVAVMVIDFSVCISDAMGD
ncbi:MAG: hypothetical protein WCO43_11730 [Chitinophagia bacterium]